VLLAHSTLFYLLIVFEFYLTRWPDIDKLKEEVTDAFPTKIIEQEPWKPYAKKNYVNLAGEIDLPPAPVDFPKPEMRSSDSEAQRNMKVLFRDSLLPAPIGLYLLLYHLAEGQNVCRDILL